MRRKHSPILDYSSPADEQRRERAVEDDRRERVEDYNESTFGERRPITSAVLRVGVFVAIAAALEYFLPRTAGRLIVLLLAVAFAAWEWRKKGRAPPSWDELWYRWRR
jgi:hypothetical protein